MFSKISWKIVGLFCLKLFLYLMLIPLSASFFQTVAFRLVLPVIYNIKHISKGSSIDLQIWAVVILAVEIYSVVFYIYILFNRYVKPIRLQRCIIILFIFVPAFYVGSQFKMAFYWSIFGNLLYNCYYYAMYYIAEYFLPSFRAQLKQGF